MLEGNIYVVESTGKTVLVTPGGDEISLVPAVSIYQYREAGAGAAITAGAWRDVALNTEVHEGIDGVSLVAGALALQPGTYTLEYESGVYVALSNTTPVQAQVRLYNVGAAAEVPLSGGSVQANGEDQGSTILVSAARSQGACSLTLAAAATIKMQIQVSVDGTYGPAGYTSAAHAQLKITRH